MTAATAVANGKRADKGGDEMAEIDVVKKRSRAWIWVLMLVVLALVLWFMMGNTGEQRTGVYLQDGQPHIAAVHITGTAGV